jgi:hypothetical protein
VADCVTEAETLNVAAPLEAVWLDGCDEIEMTGSAHVETAARTQVLLAGAR